MTQHYQGKRRRQARDLPITAVNPTLIVAVFPDGSRGYMDADSTDSELSEQIAYCSAKGARAFYGTHLELLMSDETEYQYVKSMMAIDAAQSGVEQGTRTATYVSRDRSSASDFPYCDSCNTNLYQREFRAHGDGYLCADCLLKLGVIV